MKEKMKNKVELIGHYGSDKLIACSAWTSTSRNLTEDKIARIPKLIHMLWSEGHETPFEKGVVHFLVDTEIASHIHLLKHRISSMNGESARYKELKEDKMYLPEDWDIDINIPKKEWEEIPFFTKRIIEEVKTWKEALKEYTDIGNSLYHRALVELTPILGRKRAKESARFFKTYNSQIEGDISFNMRSFANFIKLRDSEHAQLEIREIAQEMWKLVKELPGNPFEHTLDAMEKRINKN
jgi:thymidylate synthase (FAD)